MLLLFDAEQATAASVSSWHQDAAHSSSPAAPLPPPSSSSVVVTPLVQFAARGIRQDETVTSALLQSTRPADTVAIASGYFNFPSSLAEQVARRMPSRSVDILTAAPRANGFYGASGISGAIPLGYAEIERHFLAECAKVPHRAGCVRVHEYERGGWSFHGKGLWINCCDGGFARVGADGNVEAVRLSDSADACDGGSGCASSSSSSSSSSPSSSSSSSTHVTSSGSNPLAPPFVTAVGSPNFGVRSFERDLEVQFVLQSRCPTLRASLCRESQRLYKHAALVTAATWQRPERLLNGGWTWANGGWIKWGWRVFSRFL